ncbi:MAG: S1C family serine protease, partial [Thiohalomonadales bacterium]
MKTKKYFDSFFLKSVIIGFAVAFIIIMLMPDHNGSDRPVVELMLASATDTSNSGPLLNGPVSYASAVEAAAPAVVNIYTTKIITERASPLYRDPFFRRFFGDQLAPRKHLESSLGSGVIVSPQGYVLTNNHVVEGADEIEIGLRDNRTARAKIIGADPDSDLAVLKIDLEDIPAITIAEANKVRIGDVTLAIGNPFGVGQTVTMGIISATGRNSIGINTFENFIQTDAAINPGNSGGALINAYGQLIGINTAIFSKSGGSQGIGFAIPVKSAVDVMQQIIENGRVRRGWLGIEVQDIDPRLAESFGLSSTDGVAISGILRNGPGNIMGLRPGDVIIKFQGTQIRNGRQLMNSIAAIRPGNEVVLNLIRQGRELELSGEVGER